MAKETNWDNVSYTKEKFIEAWNSSGSKREVLTKLGLNNSGTATTTINKRAEELGLTAEHLIYARGGRRQAYTFEEVFIKDSPVVNGGVGLRKKLVAKGIKEDKCESCGLSEWMSKPIPLSLEHVNGDNRDNRIENLQILCLNCHGQTPTWCGKNKVRKTSNGFYPGENNKIHYCECGNTKSDGKAKRCRDCHFKGSYRGNGSQAFANAPVSERYPEIYILMKEVEETSLEAVGRKYGVSGNAVKAFIKRWKPADKNTE